MDKREPKPTVIFIEFEGEAYVQRTEVISPSEEPLSLEERLIVHLYSKLEQLERNTKEREQEIDSSYTYTSEYNREKEGRIRMRRLYAEKLIENTELKAKVEELEKDKTFLKKGLNLEVGLRETERKQNTELKAKVEEQKKELNKKVKIMEKTILILPILCYSWGEDKREITIGWLSKTYSFIF